MPKIIPYLTEDVYVSILLFFEKSSFGRRKVSSHNQNLLTVPVYVEILLN